MGHEKVEQPHEGVYRVNPDRSIDLVTDKITRPNGILVAPDDERYMFLLYFCQEKNTPIVLCIKSSKDRKGITLIPPCLFATRPRVGPMVWPWTSMEIFMPLGLLRKNWSLRL